LTILLFPLEAISSNDASANKAIAPADFKGKTTSFAALH
jgi:hypothetical protein